MSVQSPIYLYGSFYVEDFSAFKTEYQSGVIPTLQAAGAEVLVATGDPKVVEGSYDNNWTVIIKFPSQSAYDDWYASDAYAPLIDIRQKLTAETSTMLLLPAL